MTELTPTFVEIHKTNGADRTSSPIPHVSQAHEPTKEGERPAVVVMTAPLAPTVAPPPSPLKVALIGTAPSSRMLAPFNDPSWQIWACSPGNMNALPRVNVWFELHSNLLWPEHESYGKPYIEWLRQQAFPVYMQDQSLVERAIPFPMYDLVCEFGRSFFSSSFAWMMALAMQQGASEIALYGIDMASRDEYIQQRPGFFFFRHIAEQRGVKVSAPYESDIMQDPPLYAYVDSTPLGRKMRARSQEVSGRIAPMDQQISQLTNSATYLRGAKEDIDYFESIWAGAATELLLQKEKLARQDAQIATLEAEKAALLALHSPQVMLFPPMTGMVTVSPGAIAPEAPPAIIAPAETPRRTGRKARLRAAPA